MATNLALKCSKCWGNFKGKKSKSICCSICNKWVHLNCTNLSEDEFTNHIKDQTIIWRCEHCIIHRCKKCSRVVGRGNCIFCDCCNKWLHLRCSGLSKEEFYVIANSDEKWMCKICKMVKYTIYEHR